MFWRGKNSGAFLLGGNHDEATPRKGTMMKGSGPIFKKMGIAFTKSVGKKESREGE